MVDKAKRRRAEIRNFLHDSALIQLEEFARINELAPLLRQRCYDRWGIRRLADLTEPQLKALIRELVRMEVAVRDAVQLRPDTPSNDTEH